MSNYLDYRIDGGDVTTSPGAFLRIHISSVEIVTQPSPELGGYVTNGRSLLGGAAPSPLSLNELSPASPCTPSSSFSDPWNPADAATCGLGPDRSIRSTSPRTPMLAPHQHADNLIHVDGNHFLAVPDDAHDGHRNSVSEGASELDNCSLASLSDQGIWGHSSSVGDGDAQITLHPGYLAPSPPAPTPLAQSGHARRRPGVKRLVNDLARPAREVFGCEDKFQHHKDTIIRLYQTEGRTLKDTMKIMRNAYNFGPASERQYKTRLKKWEVFKYRGVASKHNMTVGRHRRIVAGHIRVPLSDELATGLAHIEELFTWELEWPADKVVGRNLGRQRCRAVQGNLLANWLKGFEMLGSGGGSVLSPSPGDRNSKSKNNRAEGFRLLHKAADAIPEAVRHGSSPMFLVKLLRAMAHGLAEAPATGSDVFPQMKGFVIEASVNILGARHPFTLAFRLLGDAIKTAKTQQRQRTIDILTEALLDGLERGKGAASQEVLALHVDRHRLLVQVSADREGALRDAAAAMNHILEDVAGLTPAQRVRVLNHAAEFKGQSRDPARQEDALGMVTPFLDRDKDGGGGNDVDPMSRWALLFTAADIEGRLGNLAGKERRLRDACDWTLRSFGGRSHQHLDTVRDLKVFLASRGA